MRQIKELVVIFGLALALPAYAQAPVGPKDEGMGDFFKATLEIDVIASGWSEKAYLAPDHTFHAVSSDGQVHGTWEVRDGKLCTTAPPAASDRLQTYCNVGVGKRIGDAWRDTDPVTGNAVFFRLVAGRD